MSATFAVHKPKNRVSWEGRPTRLWIGGNRIRLQSGGAVDSAVDLDAQAEREESLTQVCEAVRGMLASHPKVRVAVNLACRWSRILVLPWIAQLTREERWRNYARTRFEQVFGQAGDEWDLRIGRDAPGCDRIAVAWPERLRSAIASHGNVRTVRVDLLERLGVLLRHEPRFTGCLLELESDGAGFLLMLQGNVRRARWCRFDDADGLIGAVQSEWAIVGHEAGAQPNSRPALALTPPAPVTGSERAQIVAALAGNLGFRRAFCLPE